jgi:hypothetical protein
MKIHNSPLGKMNQHSLWYLNRTIAEREINGQVIILEVIGQVRAMTEVDGIWFRGIDLITELHNTDRADDESLQKLFDDDLVDMMNWFQITNDTTGDEINIDIETYDEGIKLLKELTSEEIQ